MSEPSIPLFNGDLKPVTLGDVIRLAERTNKYVERANARLGPSSPISFGLYTIPGPAAPPTPSDKAPKPPRRQRPKADPDTYTPSSTPFTACKPSGSRTRAPAATSWRLRNSRPSCSWKPKRWPPSSGKLCCAPSAGKGMVQATGVSGST